MPTLVAARPTIVVDGSESAALASGLLSLHVREHVEGLAACELLVGNWAEGDFQHFGRRLLDFGKPLEIHHGTTAVFKGTITALEGRFPHGSPPTLSVLAEDRLQDLRMTRRTRTWEDMTDAAVASEIGSDHGLQVNWSLGGPTHNVVAQVNRSDLAFLRDRARLAGGELTLDGTALTVRARTAGQAVALTYGRQLREFTALADLSEQRTEVSVSGWDVGGKQTIRESAGASAVSGEAAGGDTGPALLSRHFGDRKEVAGAAVPLSGDEARARAEALMRRRARRFVCGHGVAEPDPALRAGATVRLSGLGPLFDGEHAVVEATYAFGPLGARTEILTERAAIGR
jgi:phage protein D